MQNPIVIVSMLHPSERDSVRDLLLEWRVPAYLEGISGLREDPELAEFRIHLGDGLIDRAMREEYQVGGLIRIGGIPTHRLWRDLEGKYSSLPVLSLSSSGWTGLSRKPDQKSDQQPGQKSEMICGSLSGNLNETYKKMKPVKVSDASRFLEADRRVYSQLGEILKSEPQSEPAIFSALSTQMSQNARVYLGNSLPIREWDLAASFENRGLDVWASRGLNGIDGQVSTFLGFASPDHENWGIFGDLTALYDLQAPWVLSQMSSTRVTVVVMNNGGGKIFANMFQAKEFLNCHAVRLKGWAEMWGMDYSLLSLVPENLQPVETHRVLEILPDPEATVRFWKKLRAILR